MHLENRKQMWIPWKSPQHTLLEMHLATGHQAGEGHPLLQAAVQGELREVCEQRESLVRTVAAGCRCLAVWDAAPGNTWHMSSREGLGDWNQAAQFIPPGQSLDAFKARLNILKPKAYIYLFAVTYVLCKTSLFCFSVPHQLGLNNLNISQFVF